MLHSLETPQSDPDLFPIAAHRRASDRLRVTVRSIGLSLAGQVLPKAAQSHDRHRHQTER